MKAALLSLPLVSLSQSRGCKTLITLRLAANCHLGQAGDTLIFAVAPQAMWQPVLTTQSDTHSWVHPLMESGSKEVEILEILKTFQNTCSILLKIN